MPDFKPGTVPNFDAVQKELALVDRGDDLRVTPVLRESGTPGQIDVDLDVQDRLPLHASLEINNRYSADTAHLRLIGEVDYDDLFGKNQTLSLQYQTAPERPDEVKVWSLSYLIPVSGGPY